MEQAVLPHQAALGDAKRLDGQRSGGNWDIFGSFIHDGSVWVVHADTHFATLRIAYDEVVNHPGSDPFITKPVDSGLTLDLRADLRAQYPQRFKHLYIYEAAGSHRG